MVKIWKNGGKEDKFIAKLIKDGKIHRFSKPSKLSTDYPDVFSGFNSNVVRNHLNLLKRQHGLYLDGDSEDDMINNEHGPERSPFPTESPKNDNASPKATVEPVDTSMSGFDAISHRNYPVICEVYKDPDSGLDKLSLVLTLPAGSKTITIEVSDNGGSVTVKYTWNESMYDMTALFEKMVTDKKINIHHPRILCLKNGLEKYRKRIDAAPESTIKLTLPIRVQTSEESWSFNAVKKDGTQILLADFTGYVKEYTAKENTDDVGNPPETLNVAANSDHAPKTFTAASNIVALESNAAQNGANDSSDVHNSV